MQCPNCRNDLGSVPLDTRWIQCPRCFVAFLTDAPNDPEYYKSGSYRKSHQQADEQAFQTRRAHNVVQWVRQGVKSHLDIGCSTGALMRAVEIERGAKSYGVDLDPVLTGAGVYQSIDDIPDVQFDCVTMIHSLEHMTRPLDELRRIAARMVKNGQIIIEVPNGDARHPRGHYYGGAFNPPHVSMFSPEALAWNMANAGFSIERIFTHGDGGLAGAPSYYYLVGIGAKR